MSARDILRSVRDYQRPIHNPTQKFIKERTLVIEGVTLTISEEKLVVRTEDEESKKNLKNILSIM